MGVVLGVDLPDERGVLAIGKRVLEWVGVDTGVVGVVLAPDQPLKINREQVTIMQNIG